MYRPMTWNSCRREITFYTPTADCLLRFRLRKHACTTPHACAALAAAIPGNSKEVIMFPGTWNWA